MSDQIILLSDHKLKMPTKLLILYNKYLFNKSFLINKFQYPRYSFFSETEESKRLYRPITLSRSFLRHYLQTNKQKNIKYKIILIFSICEKFLIPLKEAGLKLSTSDHLEHWYGLVEYAKNILSLTRVLYLVNGVKSLRH